MSFTLDWQYPFTGPAPPSPVVVHTAPVQVGGCLTPPPTPPRPPVAPRMHNNAPCPPTPRCVPSCAHEDEVEWSNALNSGTSQSIPSDGWSPLELDQSTIFADPLFELASSNADHHDRYDGLVSHVSDSLIYAPELYAYPSPILTMIERASLDLDGLQTRPVDPWSCGQPFRSFSLTAGHIPVTGLQEHDEQSFDYYYVPDLSSLMVPEWFISHRFSINTIQALQRDLPEQWHAVYPEPIPPFIIRLRDLIGPYNLSRRADGYAFVVPTEDSIWNTVCQRGINSTFRPIDPEAAVETGICSKGGALYHPQHIVASKFAVNVFLELPFSEIGSPPVCEYLGAYVLQVMDGSTISRSIWADIDPEVQQSVFDRAPNCFRGPKHPYQGWPRLPYVRFCYYHWDPCIIKLVDGFLSLTIFPTSQYFAQREFDTESIYSEDSSISSDSSASTDQDFDWTEYTSILDPSYCE